MPTTPPKPVAHTTRSDDGTVVAWEQLGDTSRPALVLIHGGCQQAKHYRHLANALSGTFSVCSIDRRGRGASGPFNANESALDSLDADVADVAAVIEATGARILFGHSAGGVVALEVARRDPRIERVAVHEPAIGLDSLIARGMLSFDWQPGFDRALANKQPALAFTLFVRGLQMGPAAWMPDWFASIGAWLLMHTVAPEMAQLIYTIPRDMRLRTVDASRFASLTQPVLLQRGFASPLYIRQAVHDLAAVVAGARVVDVEGDHTAPIYNPYLLMPALIRFLRNDQSQRPA